MAAYLIVEGTISDPAKWGDYSKAVVPLIETFGGRHLNQPGSAISLEGESEGIIALFEFPNMESLTLFWNSAEYVPVKEIRIGAAELHIRAVAGK